MKKSLVLIALFLVFLVPASAEGQSYGGNMCTYNCSQQYPYSFDPRRWGCQAYCDWYCAQSDNLDNPMCVDVQDYYGALAPPDDACAG